MDRIGDYKVIRELGSGGMGRVFLCQHPRLPLEVAIKLLFEQADERARERFEREAVTMAALQDTNIVRVQDKGLQQGQPYIVMEYVPGEDLTVLLREAAPLAPERALEIARGILGGLAYAHSRGVVHRDIKPSNIRVGPGDQVKILDFGIAHLRDRDLTAGGSTLTRVGLQPGTDDYMSPEQVKGQKVDPRSDLFATGIVFYELLTGKHPFRHRSAEATRRHIANDDPAPPRAHRPDLPLPVSWLVLHALERAPENRPASAQEFADHCRRLAKEFLRESMKPGPDWRAAEAPAVQDVQALEVLGREAEHAGGLARARELYGKALAIDPALERLNDRLLGIEDAGARADEVQGLLREARQALDENRLADAEQRLQKVRLVQPDWRTNPEIEALHQDVKRRRTRSGEGSGRDRGTDSGTGEPRTPSSSERAAPPADRAPAVAAASSAARAAAVSAPSTAGTAGAPRTGPAAGPDPLAAHPGVWRSPPAITADPGTPRGKQMRRVVELFEQSEYDRAAMVLKDFGREAAGEGHLGEFLDYWRPKIEARKVFVQAEASYKQDRMNEARQHCEKALQIDPGTLRARRLLAQIEIDLEAKEGAGKIQKLCEDGEALLHSVRGDLDGRALEPAARKLVRAESLAREALEINAEHSRAVKLARNIKVYLVTISPEVIEAVRREDPRGAAAPLATPPTPRTPIPAPPSEEQQLLARLRADSGQGFAAEDQVLAEGARAALEALASQAGPGHLPPLALLQDFERSLGDLRRQAERVRAGAPGPWTAQAALAADLSRPDDLLAGAFETLAQRCRPEAGRAAVAALRPLATGDPATLEREIARLLAHPGLAPDAARLKQDCDPILAECRAREAARRDHAARQERTSREAAERAPVRAPVRAPERAPERLPERAPERPADRPAPFVAAPRPAARPAPPLGKGALYGGLAAALALGLAVAGYVAYSRYAHQEFEVRLRIWPHGRITKIDGAPAPADLQDGAVHLLRLRRGRHEVTVELQFPDEKEPRLKSVAIEAGPAAEEKIALLSRAEMLGLLEKTMRRDPFLAGGAAP